MASRKNQASNKSLPSVQLLHVGKNLTSKEGKSNFSEEEVIVRKEQAQAICLPCCEKTTPRNISSNYNTNNHAAENRSLRSESSDGKIIYRASWIHKSPRKGHRKDSSWLYMSPMKDQRNDSSSIQMAPRKGQRKDSSDFNKCRGNRDDRKHFGFDLSQNKFRDKVSPVIMASKLQHSMTNNRRSPIRHRPIPNVKSRSTYSKKGLKSLLNKQFMDCGDSLQIPSSKSFKHYINDKISRHPFPCYEDCECEKLDKHFGPGHSQGNNINLFLRSYQGIQRPIHANADFDHNENNSSDNTSVCTIFYEANGDWINEKQDSYLCQKHKDQERCHYKNHNKILELIPYPSSPKITNKCRTRDCRRDCCYSRNCCTDDILGNNLKCFTKCRKNHKTLDLIPYISSPKMSNKCLPRDCPRMCCYSRNCNTDESLENNIKCFAKCHKKHQGDHEVSIMTGIVSNHKKWGLPNEKYEAIKVIESFMNERALDEFGKRCGNAIDESNRKPLSTAASEQFCKEIEQRRKIETRVRK